MSTYEVILDLAVNNGSKLDQVINKASQLENIIGRIGKKPLDLGATAIQNQLDRAQTSIKSFDAQIQNSGKAIESAARAIATYNDRLEKAEKAIAAANPNTKKYTEAVERRTKAELGLADAFNTLTKARNSLSAAESGKETAIGREEEIKRLQELAQAARQLADDYLRLGSIGTISAIGPTGKGQGLQTSIAELSAQSEALQQLANNSKIASSEFNRFSIAGIQASELLYKANQKKLSALAFGLSPSAEAVNVGRGGAAGMPAARGLVKDLIESRKEIANSRAGLELYQQRLLTIQSIVPLVGKEFHDLAQEIKSVNNELAGTSRTKTSAFIEKTIASGKQKLENTQSIEIARQRSAALLGANYPLSTLPAGKELLPGGRTETAQTAYREMLNSAAMVQQARQKILEGMSKEQGFAATIGQLERRTINDKGRSLSIQEEENESLQRSIQIIRERNRELRQRPIAQMTPEERVSQGILDPASLRASRRARVARGRERQEALDRARSEGLIGGVFPLLFGQGAGSAVLGGLGGAAGGFAGGGLGFGLSLLGTAIGSQIDAFAQAAIDAGKAIQDPITNFQKLADAGLLASKSQEQLIKNLIEFGRSSEAASIVQQELAKKIGVLGLRDMANLGDSSIRLSKAWGELTVQLQAAIAGPLAGLLDWTASMVALFTGGNRKSAERQNFLESLPPDKRKELLNRLQSDPYGATGRSEASLFGEYQRFRRPMALPPANLSPEQQQADFDKQLQLRREEEDRTYRNAKEVEDLRRETISQQRQFEDQSIALQRQSWDLQRRVNDDIFNKQQQIQQQQISLDRAKKQIAIEIVDIEYQKRIANEEGRAAEVLAAEAELMRVRSTNEAEIESKKRMLELEIAKQKRETENYVYQLAREADGIRRATLKYELDVADYKYKREQQVDEINRRRIRENEDAQIRQDRMTGVSVAGIIARTGNTGDSTGPHLDARWADKRPITSEQIAKYILLNGKAPGSSQFPATSGYGPRNLFGRSFHYGQDFGTPVGTGISLKGGATFSRDLGNTGAGGYAAEIMTPEGAMRLLHLQRGSVMATPSTRPASQLSPPAAQLPLSYANAVRPQIAGIPVSGVGNQFTGMDAKEAEIQRKDIAFQEQLAKLGEQRVLNRVLEIAEGEKGLKQKQSELDNAKSQLQVISAYSQNQQESLSFEAESLQKIKERMDVDAEILKNTKLQGKEREQLEEALGRGLVNTQKQIDLDRQLLQIAQQTRYAKDVASLEMQLRTQGAGVAAGFSGSAAQRYVQELQISGNEAQASNLAQLQKQLDFESEIISIKDNLNQLLDPIYQVREGAKSIGSAFGESFRGTISGSMSAQEALANFFQRTADHFLEMAAQIVAQQTVLKLLNYGLSFLPGFAGAGASGAGIGTTDFSGAIAIGGARAFGGPVNAYTPYMVGEKGPELFVPSSGGNIVPNSSLGGGSVSVMVNVDAKGSQVQGDDAKSSELGRLIAASVQQELVKQQRPGGILAR